MPNGILLKKQKRLNLIGQAPYAHNTIMLIISYKVMHLCKLNKMFVGIFIALQTFISVLISYWSIKVQIQPLIQG